MVRLRGHRPRGKLLTGYAHMDMENNHLVVGLRKRGMTAPFVHEGAMYEWADVSGLCEAMSCPSAQAAATSS